MGRELPSIAASRQKKSRWGRARKNLEGWTVFVQPSLAEWCDMKTPNRRAASTPPQYRKATRRRNARAARRIPATKRLESHTPARERGVRRKTPEWWSACRASLRPGLERDTRSEERRVGKECRSR